MSQDNNAERLLLLLTDVLGDLKIVDDRSKDLWTPDSVPKELEGGGGLELAWELLTRLQILADETPPTRPDSWEALLKDFTAYCPPWVSEKDLSKKPLLAKLEILSFLASTLQNRMLKQKKPTTTSTTSDSDPLLSLPSHLTPKQKALIQACYQGLKADYDKRRVSMKQRLDILVSNILEEDENVAELKEKLQGLSLKQASFPIALNETEVLQHFTTPHSKGLKRQTPLSTGTTTTNSTNIFDPLEHLTIVDRGGRTDEIESRVTMPKWQG